MSVLVFEDETALVLEEEPHVEVIAFDQGTTLQEVPGDSTTDFLLFDAEAPVMQEVDQPPDFVLIDGEKKTETINQDGLEDLLVFSAPPGEQGPPGIPGPGAIYQEFHFAIPSTIWPIPHNLGTQAINVETVVGGEVVDGDVQYVDDDNIVIEWYYPMVGLARLFK